MNKSPLNITLGVVLLSLIGCDAFSSVPHGIAAECQRKAIERGYGRCGLEKGRQNSYGVWILKMDCSRGVVSCQNNTAGNVRISDWTSTSEFLFNNG